MSSVWLRDFQDKIHATYWYLPLLMSLLGAILAVVLYWISQLLPSSLPMNVIPSMTTADESAISNVNRAYFLGGNRTLYQDAEYGIYIIVTIAVRALSPAINDPVTPVMCLNRIGAALGMLAERISPSPYFCDNDNQLRIIVDPVSFGRFVGVAFNMIREYGRGNAEVLMKMLETIRMISTHASSEAQRTVLIKHATLIEHDSHIGLPSDYDKQLVHDTYEEALRAINRTNSGVTPDRI